MRSQLLRVLWQTFVFVSVASLFAVLAPSARAQRDLPDAPFAHIATVALPQRQSSPTNSRVTRRTRPEEQPPAPRADFWHRKYLFGEDAERAGLENEGLTLDFYYVADALANVRGGVHPGGETWWGRIRGTVNIDFSKFTRDRGLTGHITGLWQYGTDIGGTDYVDSIANPSSLASTHVFRAAEYSLSQYLLHNHLQIRGGKTAAWNTYGTQEYGASYINEPMGYALNTYANTYLTYDPGGTPAFEVRVLPTVHYYVKTMVLSEERSPYTEDPTGFSFHFAGPVIASEIGYIHNPPRAPESTKTLGLEDFVHRYQTGNYPGTYKFGGSYDPRTFTNQLTGQTTGGNYILWAQANQALYREADQGPDEHRGLDATITIDDSPNDVNAQNQQMDAGVRYIGPLRGRHFAKDMLDFGWVRSSDGSLYRKAQFLQHGTVYRTENLLEINYLANITPWLLFQPTAEFILSPNANTARHNVTVVGFRIMATF